MKRQPEKPQFFLDRSRQIIRLANNENLGLPERVQALRTLSLKYQTGWPWQNKDAWRREWAHELSLRAQVLADQIIRIEKARSGSKSVGVIEDFKTATY